MKPILTLTAAAALSSLLAVSAAQAAPAGPRSPVPTLSPKDLVKPVQYVYHCRWWRQECAARWGWGTWRFDRCMGLHGC
jgi:hypothetical protein